MPEFTVISPALWYFRAKITEVVDGDTVTAALDLGFGMTKTDRFRLAGIDTPELHSSDPAQRATAAKAKERLIALVLGKEVFVRTVKGQEKYGRWLAELFLPGEPCKDVVSILIAEGLGKPYSGGKRT